MLSSPLLPSTLLSPLLYPPLIHLSSPLLYSTIIYRLLTCLQLQANMPQHIVIS